MTNITITIFKYSFHIFQIELISNVRVHFEQSKRERFEGILGKVNKTQFSEDRNESNSKYQALFYFKFSSIL
jgi:hypothetical protein